GMETMRTWDLPAGGIGFGTPRRRVREHLFHLRHDFVFVRQKRRKLARRQRLALGHALELGDRVDVAIVPENPVVEMRAGRGTRGADAPDELTLRHADTGVDSRSKRRQMKVCRLYAARVPNAHHAARLAGI